MSNEVLDTRSKILQVAIDIVGLKGEVTIREITEKAGVNVAAINYHFGNKNNLLKEVENFYSGILYEVQYKVLMNEELNCTERLIKWAKSLIAFMFQYPALIGLIVNVTAEDKNYNPVLIEKIYLNKELQDIIKAIISEGTGLEDNKLLSYKYMQIFSGILGPVISQVVAQTFARGSDTLNLENIEELDEYINMLVRSVLI